ncbi:MAG: RNA polymerase sigma-70 factor [Chitinophagaceae bacterium]
MSSNDTYNTYTDEQLLELLKTGNEEAFTEIYQRYAETLYRFAWNILQEEDECADAVQEVFIWFWENRQKLQVTVLKYYLLAAVKYKLIKSIRNSKRREDILSARPEKLSSYEEEGIELKELKAIIYHFTEELPPRAKEIFHLSRDEYMSNREIASRLHISEKTVENQITITLKKLRRTLGHLSFWTIFL